jgi:hypothetical protein
MRITNSFWAILSQNVDVAPETVVEKARQAMLSELHGLANTRAQCLQDKIFGALDINALWYLRPVLKLAISAEQGEEVAHQKLNAITDIFREY